MPCCVALCRVASRCAVALCTVARCGAVCRAVFVLCRGGSVEVSVAGRAVAPCVTCGAGVWRVGAAPSGVCGGLFWLVLPKSQIILTCSCRILPASSLQGVVSPQQVARSAGRSVAGWWLGGAVRCGWLAGSVLWGPGRAARAGGSGRCPWGCPPWGPVPWSRVLWGSRSLALVAVAVPSSSSGACGALWRPGWR